MVADLFEQHREIKSAARDLLTAVRQSPRISSEELSRLRSRLGGLLMRHRLEEQQQIFGPLVRDGGLGLMPQIKPYLQQVVEQKAVYSLAIRQWTPKTIAENWDGYANSLAERVRGIDTMMRIEEERIYEPFQRHLKTLQATEQTQDTPQTH